MPAINIPYHFQRLTKISEGEEPLTVLRRMQKELDIFMGQLEQNLNVRMMAVGLTLSAAQSIPNNSWTVVTMDRRLHETHDGLAELTDNRVKIILQGLYRMLCRGQFASNATGARGLALWLNAAEFANPSSSDIRPAITGQPTALEVAYERTLSVGDVIQVAAFQNSGGGLNFQSADAVLTVALVVT